MIPLVVLLAEKVIIDSRSNSVTAVGLVETISSVAFPFWFPQPFIMAAFQKEEGDPTESEGSLIFMLDDEETARASFVIDFGELPRARVVLELNGMLVPRPGHLKVCVSVAGEKRGEWDVLVTQVREIDAAEEPIVISASSRKSAANRPSRRRKRSPASPG